MQDELSTREAAELLGVSEASIRRWSDEGLLPVRRIGRRLERRFSEEDLRRFGHTGRLAGRTARPPSSETVQVGGLSLAIGTHLSAFYGSDAGRLRLSVPFFADGLIAEEPCFLVAQGGVLDSYLGALKAAAGIDLQRALESGLLITAATPGSTVKDSLAFWEQAFLGALRSGHRVLRVVGEMAGVRDRFSSEDEMIAFEVAFNVISKRFPVVAVCQYDVREFTGQVVLEALKAHPDSFEVSLGRFLN